MFSTIQLTEDELALHNANRFLLWANDIPSLAWAEYVRLYNEFWAADRSVADMNAMLAQLNATAATVTDPSTGIVTNTTALQAFFTEGTWLVKSIQATRPDLLSNARVSVDGTKTEFINAAWDFDQNDIATGPTAWRQPQ